MSNPPRQNLFQNVAESLTQAVQTIQSQVDLSKLGLRPNARVPEVWVQTPHQSQSQIYPLLGDRYLIGRSPRSSDIPIDSPIVSGTHASLERLTLTGVFVIRDQNSTNGVFQGRRRVFYQDLHHGDVVSLGPPDLEDAVYLKFVNPPPLWVTILRYGLYGGLGILALVVAAIALEWQKFSVVPLPSIDQGPIVILSRDDEPLSSTETRPHKELANLREFSPHLVNGVIASEDSRYYWHLGVDPLGIVRAVLTNVTGGSLREGASTITQQLARSLYRPYVGTEDSLGRKWREAVVALKLETYYSKDILLTAYLNRVYLGVGNSGFEDAAQFYFEKSARDIDLNEAATLVGILPAPNRFNPVRDYDAAIDYRNRVITRMAQRGMITKEEADRARRSRIEVSPRAREILQSQRAPYYADRVYGELDRLLGEDLAREGNFIVSTGLDLDWQAAAEDSLRSAVAEQGSIYGFSQGAIVTLEPSTGIIRALVGGVDYNQSQFNRATQALRQPGSTFKLFVFTAALQRGLSLHQSFPCTPFQWQGQQFAACKTSTGAMDLEQGFALSENPIALRLAEQVGLSNIVQLAQQMGITTPMQAAPGLALGQSETTLLAMSGAFSVVAAQGQKYSPQAIIQIRDAGDCTNSQDWQTCRLIYDRPSDEPAAPQVISTGVAQSMTRILEAVVQRGTGRAAALGRPVAGKTGTTDDARDLWFIGYLPGGDRLTGVWLGNDDNTPTSGSSGLAADLWGRYMAKIQNLN
ncbi:transglycosylase domain-containing protein [Candidatus Synechococcus calcipolaris G9]|uniref:Transglycosylase domain-containing protein n=1 Tax=Candidatus Synechococcus calcipolaris G9 TaxID=1497997 RepID=A0ABT6EX23_9SYNE|nr:transglycosylase domain-containing protein [Candidatus Synechococcus calcipolaris]MDG2989658.1 transglycosylase domain-containing protein [Candidatus Synechococcus calcipolaris G9]